MDPLNLAFRELLLYNISWVHQQESYSKMGIFLARKAKELVCRCTPISKEDIKSIFKFLAEDDIHSWFAGFLMQFNSEYQNEKEVLELSRLLKGSSKIAIFNAILDGLEDSRGAID